MIKSIDELFNAVNELRERFAELGYNSQRIVETSVKRSFKIEAQSNTMDFPIVAYCVSTLDPLSLNRVRVYHPLLCKPECKIKDLPFARNCTNTGGFDDAGGCWVPPAGSSVVVICENGDRQMPIVIGTVWRKNRGQNASLFPYPIEEFYKLWRNDNYRGLGYLVGKTDGSQDYPPWDIENSNINNFDNEKDIDKDPDAQKNITYPNIYGWKTPGKHYIKMVDGDYRCNNKWARFEIVSKTGHWFIMKDDWYHPSGDWANPKGACAASGEPDDSSCESVSALLSLEISGASDVNGDNVVGQVGGGVGTATGNCSLSPDPIRCSNPKSKRVEECRPYRGSILPQNNKCELPQSGIHSQSVSGHQSVMDDAVKTPREGKVNWQHVYDTGCDDTLKGKFYFKSATGHMILMDDTEDDPKIRGKRNGIRLQSAAGNYFYLKDHTLAGCIAGDGRGVEIGSTSGHVFTMNDNQNEHCSPTRRGFITRDTLKREADLDPVPAPKAKNAYVQLRSGYGLLLRFDDSTTQEETAKQFIMLLARPKDKNPPDEKKKPNPCQQPHMLLMQLDAGDGGFVELTSGGKFILTSVKSSYESVGTEGCVADKITAVSGNYLIEAKKVFLTKSQTHLDLADKYIILGAGQDCPIDPENANKTAEESAGNTQGSVSAAKSTGKDQKSKGPCIYPLIVAKDAIPCPIFPHIIHWTKWSNRVFASSSQDT
jgi:hypothetical protein